MDSPDDTSHASVMPLQTRGADSSQIVLDAYSVKILITGDATKFGSTIPRVTVLQCGEHRIRRSTPPMHGPASNLIYIRSPLALLHPTDDPAAQRIRDAVHARA